MLTAGLDHLTGHGITCKNPADPDLPIVGAEIAVARALTDLADQLNALANTEIGAWTPVGGVIVLPDATSLTSPFTDDEQLDAPFDRNDAPALL